MTDNNALVPAGNKAQEVVTGFQSGTSNLYSSFNSEDRAGKLKLLSAITDAAPLNENLDKRIDLENIVLQATTLTDDETGEVSDVVRIILIDADGSAYAAISGGLLKSLQNITGIFGDPSTWSEPLPIKVTEVRSKRDAKNRFFTVKLWEDDAPAAPKSK